MQRSDDMRAAAEQARPDPDADGPHPQHDVHHQRDGHGTDARNDLPDAPDPERGDAIDPDRADPTPADAQPFTTPPAGEGPAAAQAGAQTQDAETGGPVLGRDRAAEYQERWREVQTSFVDNPATAVRSADQLVSEVVDSLTSALAEQQRSLGAQWREVPDSATEDLRTAMMRYRTVFQRLIEI